MTEDFEVHTLATPYALHALPADEVEPFERHLRLCTSCQAEVDEIREVAARMGAGEAVTPPAELKQRVLAEIATVRRLPPLLEDQHEPPASGVTTTSPTWRRWWPRVSVAAAAALLIAVGVLGSRLSDTQQDLDDEQRLSAEIQQVVSAPDMQQTTKRTPNGKAVVMSSRSADTAVLVPLELDPVPDDRTYQAWLIDGDEIRSAGLIGDESSTPLATHELNGASQVGITVEPSGGSDQPTTDPVVLIDVPA